ncbi:GTPase HflX OS=Streptomyces albaduncus OX=68172 GN=hflX PE=3 SV=1 [Streptomyces griseoloalbus]
MRIEKRSIAVSARTGQGLDELLALIDGGLPRVGQIEALVPYTHTSWSPQRTRAR